MYRAFALKSIAELEQFRAAYHQAAGADLPLAFLQESTVFALLYRERASDPIAAEVMVGGLVLRNRHPFRSEDGIVGELAKPIPESVIEIVGLFLEPEHRKLRARAYLALGCLLAIMLSRQDYILAATTKDRLWQKTYRKLGGEVLYHGPISLSGGPQRDGRIFVLPRRRFFRRLPWYIMTRPFFILTRNLFQPTRRRTKASLTPSPEATIANLGVPE